MKKKYAIQKIISTLFFLLLLFAMWQQFRNNQPNLIPIVLIPTYFLLEKIFFKRIEYENKKVDTIFETIRTILCISILILLIYMFIYR